MKFHRALCLLSIGLCLTASSCAKRRIRMAKAVNTKSSEPTSWQYGATDIRMQTACITKKLMDRWYSKTTCAHESLPPQVVIGQVDNRTDCYISTDMIRDIIEGIAAQDGRFTVCVGDMVDEADLDAMGEKILNAPKYHYSTGKILEGNATPPRLLATIRIVKATTATPRYDLEDYRMAINLYDIETQELVDSASDVLQKKVYL